jgi:outer membrane protein assembly factor BamD
VALPGLLALVLAAGCAGGKKQPEGPVLPEADPAVGFRKALRHLSKHDLRQATAVLDRIPLAADVRADLEPLTRLARADATFYQGNSLAWIDARNLYLNFVGLYAEHPLAPYAQLQVGTCSFKQANKPTRDQGLTLQAIHDLEAVEARWPDSPYVDAGRSLLRQARANLAASEYLVGNFYRKRKNYAAAISRYRGIVVRFPDFPQLDDVLYSLAQSHLAQGSPAEARVYLGRLVTEYPGAEQVEDARRTLAKIERPASGDPQSQ